MRPGEVCECWQCWQVMAMWPQHPGTHGHHPDTGHTGHHQSGSWPGAGNTMLLSGRRLSGEYPKVSIMIIPGFQLRINFELVMFGTLIPFELVNFWAHQINLSSGLRARSPNWLFVRQKSFQFERGTQFSYYIIFSSYNAMMNWIVHKLISLQIRFDVKPALVLNCRYVCIWMQKAK